MYMPLSLNSGDPKNAPDTLIRSHPAAGLAGSVLNWFEQFRKMADHGSPILRNCSNQFNTDPASPAAGCDRITVSGAFFGSPEFKDKGIYIIDFYRVAFNRLPQYAEFSPDLASLAGATAAEANAKRAAFANNFVLRAEFATLAGMSNSTYVTTLRSHMG